MTGEATDATGTTAPEDVRSADVPNVSKRVVLVVAVARNGVIGKEGEVPWHLPEDMRHFRATTTGNTVVMGRKTYESIGRPLPRRTNIVVTRQRDWRAEGVLVEHSVESAIARAQQCQGEVMVIGGAQVYAAAMEHADVQIITEVHDSPEGDTFYPRYDPDAWVEVRRVSGERFDLVRLERRSCRGSPPSGGRPHRR